MRKSFALCEAFGLTPFGPRTVPVSFREAPAARRGETAWRKCDRKSVV